MAYIEDLEGERIARADGEPGEANDIAVRAGGDGVVITDSAGIRPRDPEGCRSVSVTEVTCTARNALLFGADGVDKLADAGLDGTVFAARGGAGNDTIVARSVPARLHGDDLVVRADDGDDEMYGSTTAAATSSLQKRQFDDVIHGGGGFDRLYGLAGVDFVAGQAGNDIVAGNGGDDLLDGSLAGGDSGQRGDLGNDNHYGGDGDDWLVGAVGSDWMRAEAGDDFLQTLEERDAAEDGKVDDVVCGPGLDRFQAARGDRVARTCERMSVPVKCPTGYPCGVSAVLSVQPRQATRATVVGSATRSLTKLGAVEIRVDKRLWTLIPRNEYSTVKGLVTFTKKSKRVGTAKFRFFVSR